MFGFELVVYYHKVMLKKCVLILFTCLLVGCRGGQVDPGSTTPISAASVRLPRIIENIKLHEEQTVGNLKFTITGIDEDSRCPMNARCIQAGRVAVRLSVKEGTSTGDVILQSDGPAMWQAFLFTILSVSPEMVAGESIEESEYRFMIEVSSATSHPTATELGEISWTEAQAMIAGCRVQMIVQTHDLKISMTLKDGTQVRTVEPRIDDVFDEIDKAKAKCGDVVMATE